MIRHMKANHTESLSKIETNMHIKEHSAQLAEDMSICIVSDDEDVHKSVVEVNSEETNNDDTTPPDKIF